MAQLRNLERRRSRGGIAISGLIFNFHCVGEDHLGPEIAIAIAPGAGIGAESARRRSRSIVNPHLAGAYGKLSKVQTDSNSAGRPKIETPDTGPVGSFLPGTAAGFGWREYASSGNAQQASPWRRCIANAVVNRPEIHLNGRP